MYKSLHHILVDDSSKPTTIKEGDFLICESRGLEKGFLLVVIRNGLQVYWQVKGDKDNKSFAGFIKDMTDLIGFVHILAGSHGLHAQLVKHSQEKYQFVFEKPEL
jgi:hypothetical protein